MPEAVRGKVKFEKLFLQPHQSREDEIERYSCLPRPHGSRRGANPRLEVPVVLLRDYLQESEADRLRTAAANQGETLTFETLWPAIMTLLDLDKLTIDLSKMPQDWRGEDCCDCVNAVIVNYETYTVTALANEPLTFGNETYPKGDAIAAWRACEPVSYQFIRRCTPNPECCPDGPTETPPVQKSDTFLKPGEIGYYWPLGDGWEFSPGWEFRPRLDFRPYWRGEGNEGEGD